MGFPGGAALLLQRIIYGPSIGTAQRVDQTLPGNPCADPGNAGPILLASQAASRCRDRTPAAHRTRSEEHTSELQSRLHLVCRLLLEKKKKKIGRRIVEKTYPTSTLSMDT